jgi:hypothetical protein
VLKLLVTI